MKVHTAQVQFKSTHSFRHGEWADVVSVVIVVPDNGAAARLCYHLRFSDGTCDYTPISEPHDIRSAG